MTNAPFYLAIGTDQHGAARLWACGDTKGEAIGKMARARSEYKQEHPERIIRVTIKVVSSD